MRFRIGMVLSLAAGTLGVASLAQAQARLAPVHLAQGQWALDGSLGVGLPTGDYGTFLNAGIDLMAAVEVQPTVTGKIYFRGEIGYSDFGGSSCGVGISCPSSNIVRFGADAMYDLPLRNTRVSVYGLGGIGLYHIAYGTSATGFGLNFGGGVRFPVNPVQLFFETRWQLPMTGPGGLSYSPYFPFQFGVRYLLPRK